MSYTTQDLANLKAALASGSKVVEYNGNRTEFRSVSELIRAIDVVSGELRAAGLLATAPMNRGPFTLASFTRD